MPTRTISASRQERLDAIIEVLLADDTTSAQALAESFGISLMTVHRDLDELQRRGIVRKFRGGVSVARTSTYEISAPLRRRLSVAEKVAIAAAAARTVAPGSSILLDDSTTVAAMLDHLVDIEDLHVVTNYLPTLAALTRHGGSTVTGIGGTYDVGHESFLGLGAVDAIRALRVDVAFLSTTTVDVEGLYHQEESIVAVKSAMIRSARRRVLLADSTKFGTTSFHRICDWDVIHEVVTDTAAPAELLDTIRARGVRVTTVEPRPTENTTGRSECDAGADEDEENT
ncbi:DeoR/GlpR family DNA-binding transcription regulator [Rhodococcus rhodochrous]|uniref:DeoR/GlpR family DNA-binding transcription regulator n=1 Tax=Rhodococcus rhodochrous TaxID=1829 RepID=UPI0023F78EEC